MSLRQALAPVARYQLTTLATIHYMVSEEWRSGILKVVGGDEKRLWLQANFKKDNYKEGWVHKTGYEYVWMDHKKVDVIKNVGKLTMYLRGDPNINFFFNSTQSWPNLYELSFSCYGRLRSQLCAKAPNLKRLKFFRLDEFNIDEVSGLQELEYLEIEAHGASKPAIETLDLPKLKHVAVYYLCADISTLGVLPEVERLELDTRGEFKMTSESLSKAMPNLRIFELNRESPESLDVVANLSKISHLFTPFENLASLRKDKRQDILEIRATGYAYKGCLSGYVNLEHLTVVDARWNGQNLLDNIFTDCKSLRSLHLQGVPELKETGLGQLAKLEKLETLKIQGVTFTDQFLENISTSVSLKTLIVQGDVTSKPASSQEYRFDILYV